MLNIYVQLLSHVQLFCDPTDCSPLGSAVHGISKVRTLFQQMFQEEHFLLQGIFPTQGSTLHFLHGH